MIELRNISRQFKVGDEYIHALDRLTLSISEGQFIALMGPSGSGKTTLLNLIGGLDRPDGGQIVVDGTSIERLKDGPLSSYRNKTIGFVFQSFNLQPTYTALENVMLPLYFAKVGPGERRKRAQVELERVGLSNRAKHKPSQLSAGQRQRVAIARALINRPKIILADEPTGNLDSRNGKDIMELLKQLNRESKVTVVMVTHDEGMAKYAGKTIYLRDGKMRS